MATQEFDAEYTIHSIVDERGKDIPFTINETMIRLDLERPLRPTRKSVFKIKWSYNLHEQKILGGRFGYEYFEEEKNHIFQMSIFYPRLAAYSDAEGWHNKQFLGGGEFT